MNMPDRTLATILAALRFWQHAQANPSPKRFNRSAYMMEIATDGGHFENLSAKEIDKLCEHLNAGDESETDKAKTAELISACWDLHDLGGHGGTDAVDRVKAAIEAIDGEEG